MRKFAGQMNLDMFRVIGFKGAIMRLVKVNENRHHLLLSCAYLLAQPPAQVISIAQESLHDGTPQTIAFPDGTPLLWAIPHDLPGFEPAVEEQVGDPLLPRVGQHRPEDLPD